MYAQKPFKNFDYKKNQLDAVTRTQQSRERNLVLRPSVLHFPPNPGEFFLSYFKKIPNASLSHQKSDIYIQNYCSTLSD